MLIFELKDLCESIEYSEQVHSKSNEKTAYHTDIIICRIHDTSRHDQDQSINNS
jgi:hypothetical protein